MIVPEYWAEARREVRHNCKQLIVRRFGWSDECVRLVEPELEERSVMARLY